MDQEAYKQLTTVVWRLNRRYVVQNVFFSLLDLALMIFLLFSLSNTTPQERINHVIFGAIFLLTLYLYFQWRLLWRRVYQKRETSVSERERALKRREQEMQSCYELEHVVNEVNDITQQLTLIAYAIVNNFSYYGVKGCALYLRSESDRPSLQANAAVSGELLNNLSHEDEMGAMYVLTHGVPIELRNNGRVEHAGNSYVLWEMGKTMPYERHLLPLYGNGEVLGVLYLVVSEKQALRFFTLNKGMTLTQGLSNPETEVSYRMLKLAIAVIERARTQLKLRENEALQKKEQMYQTMISVLSHELRFPLTILKGNAQLLSREGVWDDAELRANYLNNIEGQVDSLDHFIAKIVNISHIEGGKLKPEKQFYYIEDVEDLIRQTVTKMEARLQGCLPKITIATLPPVELDPLLIKHVLENLIENAIRYAGHRTPLEISVEQDGEYMLVSVADRGPGVDAEHIRRIFNKYYRSLTSPGMGLGLSICYNIIDAHDGRIWADKRDGGGALFQFFLPLSKRGEDFYAEESS